MLKVKDLKEIKALIYEIEKLDEAIEKNEFNIVETYPGLRFKKGHAVHTMIVQALKDYRKVIVSEFKKCGMEVDDEIHRQNS